MKPLRTLVWSLTLALLFVSVLALRWITVRGAELRADERRAAAELTANRALAARAQAAAAKLAKASGNARTDSKSKEVARPMLSYDRGHAIRVALLHMPEYAPLVRAEYHRRTMREYGEWLRQLNVPPQRLALIKEALSERIATQQDGFDAATDAGYRQGTMEFEAVWARFRNEAEERLKQTLTPEEYASYSEYQKTWGWTYRQQDELEDYLGERGLPALTLEQKKALSSAYVASRAWKPGGVQPPAVEYYRMANDYLANTVESALDPAQREAVRGYLKFLNERSVVLGRLFRPNAPDAVIITPGGMSSR